MHSYKINPCSHTICQNCLYAAIEDKLCLHHDNIICPQCTDSEACLKHLRNLQVVLPIEDHLRTFSQTHETEMSWHILKSSICRSCSKYIYPLTISWYFRSPISFYTRRYYQFLQVITTYPTLSWLLLLFTILFGSGAAHYLHEDLHSSAARSLKVGYIFYSQCYRSCLER